MKDGIVDQLAIARSRISPAPLPTFATDASPFGHILRKRKTRQMSGWGHADHTRRKGSMQR
jgi:hypothetical protein